MPIERCASRYSVLSLICSGHHVMYLIFLFYVANVLFPRVGGENMKATQTSQVVFSFLYKDTSS